MASKKRSHASTSSSQSPFDRNRFPTLSRARLYEESYKDRSVESEREVATELQNKAVFRSLVNRNWDSLLKFNTKVVYPEWVREFYCNLDFEEESNSLKTYVRGKALVISVSDIAEFLEIPVVQPCAYPIPADNQAPIDYNRIGSLLRGRETLWPSGLIPHGELTEEYRFLNRFVCHNLEPRGHTSDISQKNGYFLYCIGTGQPVNVPQVLFNSLLRMFSAKKNAILPFAVFITEYLLWKEVPKRSNEPSQKVRNPINSRTLALSSSHVPAGIHAAGEPMEQEEVAPAAQPQGEPHAQMDSYAQLSAQMQAMSTNIDARFAAVDQMLSARFNAADSRLDAFDMRFNTIEEGIASLLAHFPPPQ